MFLEILKIWKIAKSNPDGFTLDIKSSRMIKSGIISAYSETQNSFGLYGLLKCYFHAKQNDLTIGGWQTSKGLQFDSCKVFKDRKQAIKFGIENEQIAIFDLDNLEEIRL